MSSDSVKQQSVKLPLSALVCATLLLRKEAPSLAEKLEQAVIDTVGRIAPINREKAYEALNGAKILPLKYEHFALNCALLAAWNGSKSEFIFADPDEPFPVGYLECTVITRSDGCSHFEYCESYDPNIGGKAYASKLRLTDKETEGLRQITDLRPEAFFSAHGALIVSNPGITGKPFFSFNDSVVSPADILRFEKGRVVRERIGTVTVHRIDEEALSIEAQASVMMTLTAASFDRAWLSINPAEDASAKQDRQPRLFFRLPSPEHPGTSVRAWTNAVVANSAFDVRNAFVTVPVGTAAEAVRRFPWLACADERCLMSMILFNGEFDETDTRNAESVENQCADL